MSQTNLTVVLTGSRGYVGTATKELLEDSGYEVIEVDKKIGRNSNNDLIKEKLGWSPSIDLKDGIRETYFWIKDQIDQSKASQA